MKLLISLFAFLPAMSFATVVIRPSVNEGFFVCNAGIAHKVSTGTSCVNQLTGLACTSSDESSCVCSDSTAGDDSLAASWEDLTVAASSSMRFRSNIIASSASGDFTSLFTDLNAWSNQVNEVQINSSSETYGTKYFIDFCYQGPIENIVKKKDNSEGIYTLTAGINAQNLANGSSYAADSNLAMNLAVNCDLRNVGKNKDPRNSNQFAPEGSILESDVDFTTTGYPRANSLSLSQRINGQVKLVPRFCVVRATFAEMANTTSVKVRPNNETPTEFTIDLDITNGSAF
ncbi:hypothetical protein [Bdellovibrio svalbardensis]|uniref:Uncharacterized protein n=1 Tax=Bdellovibrio svalbardensis TaxID=2972972 RepID=A0ABT6DEE5_9BACT|nr:hypothetical protein [Bdellovibrio svalbardensis]MDG0814899.1 hypothetical protein [Bdellovibrio svalbardensis]